MGTSTSSSSSGSTLLLPVSVILLRCFLSGIDAGEAFTIGDGECRELGHGSNDCAWFPRLVEALVGRKAVAIAGGRAITPAIASGSLQFFRHGPMVVIWHCNINEHTEQIILRWVYPTQAHVLREMPMMVEMAIPSDHEPRRF